VGTARFPPSLFVIGTMAGVEYRDDCVLIILVNWLNWSGGIWPFVNKKECDMPQEIIEVPITGKIISVEAKVGDSVQEGDVICTIEAMKMENPIMAPVSGKVTEVKVKTGDVVSSGGVIAVIDY
jgi:acetyl-CoA carboxylase biotin carboxyl carrier protein